VNPQGAAVWPYTSNVLAKGGRAAIRIPLALNDPPGTWQVRVRDVLSGVAGQAVLKVFIR